MKNETDYDAFIASKQIKTESFGITPDEPHSLLFPFQKDIVKWALKRGRACVFADCGLGKTFIQLEWARQIPGNVLILAPLAVAEQTVREGIKLGMAVTHAHDQSECKPGVNVTNYERLHLFDCSKFAGLVLDESSILKNYSGATRKQLQDFAQDIRFKLACTATPAPNDLIEIINHAEFINVMSGKEIIALFFKQDGNTTHAWRLKGHAREPFYKWLAQWAVALRKPSDLGYEDNGFVLPPLRVHHVVVDGATQDGYLFPMLASTLDERRASRRASLGQRVQITADLVNGTKEPFIVWCDLNSESESLRKAIPGAVEVKGSDSIEHKEQALRGFSAGEFRVLITKPSIAGHGMNWQHCAHVAFVGLSDSYEQYYQAVRRCWRFGQKREVNAYVVTASSEGAVVANIERKEAQAQAMMASIVAEMSIYETIHKTMKQVAEYKTNIAKGKGWQLMLGDSCERIKELKAESVGLTVFSPPFPGMYTYTNSPRDIGNTTGVGEMMEHFSFLIPELLRITAPGRMCCIHLMQLTAMLSRDGYIGLKDYRGAVIDAMIAGGWVFAGEVTIDKNPQVQAVRNKERGLMFKTLASDSSLMRMALADYIIYFRKPGENAVPIHAGISEKYKNPHGWITEEEWIEWAAPVWYRRIDKTNEGRRDTKGYPGAMQATTGIMETDVLNVSAARDEKDERHLCPLQLGVIERCVKLWSAPGDTVFSPFAGVGSEGHVSLTLGRKFIGIELKESYWRQAAHNLKMAEQQSDQQLLKP